MNELYVGFSKQIMPPKGSWLWIDDEVVEHPKKRVFDPMKDTFNPLKNISYKKAREIANVLYTISPQGENTLTVRNGKRGLLKALLGATRLDEIQGDEEVQAMVDDLLVSPVLRGIFCSNRNDFSFTGPNTKICARLNRAELGDFDALAIGLLLMATYKGQLIIPDFGFYGRDAHLSLIRENRLIAGVNFLGELSPRLRNGVLLIKDKEGHSATANDAETLAAYNSRFVRGTQEFTGEIEKAMR